MNIDLVDETNHLSTEQLNLVNDVLHFAADQQSVESEAEMSVTFVSDEDIKGINRDYRGKDASTDVISFALEEQGEDELEVIGEGLPLHLGDIVISVDRAFEQAGEYGHSNNRELAFLAVHGLLHLLGYDHESEDDEKVMFEKQEKILQKFGLTRNEK
ncbi:rRNA maturation RNase YbeY [Alkalibacillus haloalkaliphilus]|uniref:rRNA maturation RNase YbeY n=1 Tax=Alkalibacillus haloalkaliphilus TaxID=94136 RepID=UPI0029362637|nr:rRNA maturation RNase YbeY [Alkalibacillus haloalkaliphilus]MDV2581021.1 rRNA maturation RNase YbeY [Alkalibacillus haloalkaliphilus]